MPMNNRILRPLARPLLLDAVPGAAAAYSLRQLSNAYTGPVVTVRRSSDDAEADFKASEIDDGTLAAFCGAGDGFVKTWHDQSGSGNDASQGTAASQPKIVDSGSLVTEGGKATVDFDGTNDYLDIATVTVLGCEDATIPHSIACVFKCDQTSGSTFISSNYNSVGLGTNVLGFEATKIVNLRAGAGSTNTATAPQDTELHVGFHWYQGGVSAPRLFAGYRDGAILPTVPADGVFTDSGSFESNIALRLGRWGTLSIYFDGRIGEYILWPADLLANRERIEGDIAWYY